MGVSVVEEEKALWGRRKNTAFFAILHSLINHHQHSSFSESEKHSYGSLELVAFSGSGGDVFCTMVVLPCKNQVFDFTL